MDPFFKSFWKNFAGMAVVVILINAVLLVGFIALVVWVLRLLGVIH